MTKPITIPNTFASATSAIPLAQLDQDFSTLANATNDLATYSNYVADTGAADAFIANYPANTNTSSLTTGLRLQFKAANANTGASTLNVQVNGASIGTASIRLTDGSALPANTIIAGALVDVMYDGTNFQIMNDPSGGQEIISNLTLSGNLTVAGTSTFTGNVTGNVVNTTTSTITNLTSGNVTITGGSIDNISITNLTSLTVDGDTTLGDASGDTLTITGTTVTTPNGLNFDSNTLVIDAANNRVGIGTASPAEELDVNISQNGQTRIQVKNTSTGTGAQASLYVANSDTGNYYLSAGLLGTSFTSTGLFVQNSGQVFTGSQIDGLYIHTQKASPLVFGTLGTERMRIGSNGNVGIGTTSTSGARLQISDANSAITALCTNGTISLREAGASSANNSVDVHIRPSSGKSGYLTFTEDSVADRWAVGIANGVDALLFKSGGFSGTERMRIDSSGRVGINTSSPTSFLTINTGASAGIHIFRSDANANFDGIVFRNSANNTNQSKIGWNGNDLRFESTGNTLFETNGAERMRITSDGIVRINNTANATYNTQLNVYFPSTLNAGIHCRTNTSSAISQIIFGNATNDFVGDISTNGSATAYNTSSDYRLKENIAPMTGALAKVAQLKPVTYNWKADGSNGQGFIAHELQAVVPDAVTGEKDGELMQGVDYGKITPLLTAALQEALAKIELLEARLAALESK